MRSTKCEARNAKHEMRNKFEIRRSKVSNGLWDVWLWGGIVADGALCGNQFRLQRVTDQKPVVPRSLAILRVIPSSLHKV